MSKWDEHFMFIAEDAANRLSHAKKLKVGAVAVRDNRPFCEGFNGTPPGFPNECEDFEGNTYDSVIHAEMNLVLYAAKHGISLKDSTLYTTHAPCISCAVAIHGAGVTKVVYKNDYKKEDGLLFLREAKVKLVKFRLLH